MKPLFSKKDFDNAKTMDKLPCECYYCSKTFYETKREINNAKNPNHPRKSMFCSRECKDKSQETKQKVKCTNCNNEFEKIPREIKKSKSGNHFCSRSCSATYNNKHKSHGTRRSKLEVWLEAQLSILYPDVEIHYNQKYAINSELDIYIPDLSLAIELNGIFHYEPIFGEDKLSQIQNNDQRKFQACLEEGIELALIDVSQLNYFKPKKAQKYLDIVCQLISNKSKSLLES